jgi:hypothetical protein
VDFHKVETIERRIFGESTSATLTITMGAAPPTLGHHMFGDNDQVLSAKTVIVKVPTANLSD